MSNYETTNPEVIGFFPSDLIIRSAIVKGLADIRLPENRWILERTFKNQTLDPLTQAQYGQNEVDRALEWFLKTDIPVFFGAIRVDDFKIPSITLELLESSEDAATLGEIHYSPWEIVKSPVTPQIFGAPFTPTSYNQTTGAFILPPSQVGVLPIFVGMSLVEQSGKRWVIEKVLDANTYYLAPGSVANLTNCTLQASEQVTPSYAILANSVMMKETYRIGVHVNSEPAHMIYMHDLLRMVLMSRRKDLLEARGLERTSISSSDMAKNFALEGEIAFSRFITLVGYVRQSWPQSFDLRAQGIITNP